jgi:hypothetical protein
MKKEEVDVTGVNCVAPWFTGVLLGTSLQDDAQMRSSEGGVYGG